MRKHLDESFIFTKQRFERAERQRKRQIDKDLPHVIGAIETGQIKLYSTMQRYKPEDRDQPPNIVMALFVDYDEVDMVDMYGYIVEMQSKLNNLIIKNRNKREYASTSQKEKQFQISTIEETSI